MKLQHRISETYEGFEQGPIRPPSEAQSLLIRITRNCPWNHCTFCPVYKGTRFSVRPPDHVKRDIDLVHRFVEEILKTADASGRIDRVALRHSMNIADSSEAQAFQAALHWHIGGMKSVFLQDANSLIIKPSDLTDILTHLKHRFPWVERITSYARSHTIARIQDDDLKAFRHAGLNRIHIGMESGSDAVLKLVKKGVDKATHIKAGLKVKAAGMELSEYIMPGLGGKALSDEHAIESADAVCQINPHFIRLRTLAIPNFIPLYDDYASGRFEKCPDIMVVKEIHRFIKNLNGIDSVLKSDHILNLFQEVEGQLPQDKDAMLSVLERFLSMKPETQCVYQIGRRTGIFSSLSDMESPTRMARVQQICRQHGITPENADAVIDELMKRFI